MPTREEQERAVLANSAEGREANPGVQVINPKTYEYIPPTASTAMQSREPPAPTTSTAMQANNPRTSSSIASGPKVAATISTSRPKVAATTPAPSKPKEEESSKPAPSKPKEEDPAKPGNTPPDKPSNTTPSKKRKGPTIPVSIYNTNFDVEQDVETGNLTETQQEIADILELDTFADRVRGETPKEEYIADVLRNVIIGCTSDGTITLGPHCPKINHYLAALSLLILQEGPLRGKKPAPKAQDMYGDVTFKICIPIAKLIKLLELDMTPDVAQTPIDTLKDNIQTLSGLIQQYNAAQNGGGGDEPGTGTTSRTKAEIKQEIDALIGEIKALIEEIRQKTPDAEGFEGTVKEFDTLVASVTTSASEEAVPDVALTNSNPEKALVAATEEAVKVTEELKGVKPDAEPDAKSDAKSDAKPAAVPAPSSKELTKKTDEAIIVIGELLGGITDLAKEVTQTLVSELELLEEEEHDVKKQLYEARIKAYMDFDKNREVSRENAIQYIANTEKGMNDGSEATSAETRELEKELEEMKQNEI
jgi:hypothetical protein